MRAFSSLQSRHHFFSVFTWAKILCHLYVIFYLCLCLWPHFQHQTVCCWETPLNKTEWCVLLFSKCQVVDHTVACCMFMFTSPNLQLTGFFPKGLAGWKKNPKMLVFLLQLHFCLQYLRSHCYYESKASLVRSADQGEMSVNMLFP